MSCWGWARTAPGDTLAVIPGYEEFLFDQGSGGRPLFGREGHMAVHGGRLYLGSADGMAYQVRSSEGALEQLVRAPGFDLSLSGEEVAREREVRSPASYPAMILRAVADMPAPRTRPAYSDLLIDAAGNVWLPGFHGVSEADEPTDCQVFDPDGAWLGAVRLPPGFHIFEVGDDYVLGVTMDAMDVQHVQMLRLRR